MRLLIQRVSEAHVTVERSTIGSIRSGLLVFVGIAREDSFADADYAVQKMVGLRIFPDAAGKMNCSVQEAGGSLLLVSQFTLYGDCRKGRRPSFDRAAPPAEAQALYEYFVESARQRTVAVQTGVFQAHMEVHLINDGPVTILLDSDDRQKKTAP